MGRTIKFEVITARVLNRHLAVIGRCIEGPIRIGDVFVSFQKRKYIRSKDTMEIVKTNEEFLGTILLSVVRIIVYGRHELDELEPPFPGEIHLQGDGTGLILNEALFTDNWVHLISGQASDSPPK